MIGYMQCNECGHHFAEEGSQLGIGCPKCGENNYMITVGKRPDWYKGGEPVNVYNRVIPARTQL